MSQNILNKNWFDSFVAEWHDKEHAMKLANRLQRAVSGAMKTLDEIKIGQVVVFEGSCPSGDTYEGYFTWDGSAEMREEIAKKAYDLGGFDAWAATLVKAKEGKIVCAKMRTA